MLRSHGLRFAVIVVLAASSFLGCPAPFPERGRLDVAAGDVATGDIAVDAVTPDVSLSDAPDAVMIDMGPAEASTDVVTDRVAPVDARSDASTADAPDGCGAGKSLCSGVCVDRLSSCSSCGVCGQICSAGRWCVDGQCLNECSGSCGSADCAMCGRGEMCM